MASQTTPATSVPTQHDPTTSAPGATTGAPSRRSRWIDDWRPEDTGFWTRTGRAVARRNLRVSIVAEFLGFSVWQLWTIATPQLNAVGYALTADEMLWLIAVPNLVGATLRLPYTFAVPRFGGRTWTTVSAGLLVLPCATLVVAVQNPGLPFGVLLALAALAGLGGGNFASSMANISFFYPEREKGKALGMNAAGGNIGVAVVQGLGLALITAGAGLHVERLGYVIIPLAVLAAFLAWRLMDNLSAARSALAGYGRAARSPQTWVISFLYVGTFGSFIGYAGAFPTLLVTVFPEQSLSIAFLGALVGSLTRPYGGALADRFGGAVVSVGAYAAMAVGAAVVTWALAAHSFPAFFGAFLLLFVASGIGNGSVYRMIPAVFRSGVAPTDVDRVAVAKRYAAACIGIAAAVGAYGGFLVPRGFAVSTTATGSLVPALGVFIAFYAICIAVVWACYLRPGTRFAAEGTRV